jgi:Transposase DDE domain
VATQDTVAQLISAIRRVAREVPGAAEQAAAVCTGHDCSRPGKPKIGRDDPAAKDALVPALVNDATALVEALRPEDPGQPEAPAVALLALVAGQDVEPAGDSDGTGGRWRIARKVAGDRVVSVVDPDARHTRTSPEARRDGYRARLAACPQTGIITGEKLTRACGQDNPGPAVAAEFLAAGAGTPGPAPDGGTGSADGGRRPGGAADPDGSRAAGGDLTWYGDSAYGTGDLRDAIDKAGHRAVIKPKPLQAPVAGGLTVDGFTVSEEQGTVTCPAGHTVKLSRTRVATFGALCRDCPLRSQCTTCKTGRKLVLHPRDDLLRAARADWVADPGLRQDYMAHRPDVERAVAQVATFRGRRLKLRYRGTAKNHAWLKRRTAALNLRNLAVRGLARRAGARVLAT